ncbi:MAG: hypothetical protein M1820_008147 [Bogoriella megaspora]|nr:MAG: hypothetical protein M1820_008147 [Bogoriella megaspora]
MESFLDSAFCHVIASPLLTGKLRTFVLEAQNTFIPDVLRRYYDDILFYQVRPDNGSVWQQTLRHLSLQGCIRKASPKIDTQPFQYDVLPTSRHTRFVELHGSEANPDDICCTIKTVAIDSHPPYEALSYTWGSSNRSSVIRCNNSTLPVTNNLEQALQRLKPRGNNSRMLWIDAISINQDDPEERSSQVQFMRDIFHSADRVLIWIGEEQDHDAEALALAQKLTQLSIAQAQNANKDLVSAGLPPRGSPDWQALEALYLRKIFSRVWCIQEIAVAQKATIICGGISAPWDHLIGSLKILDTFKLFYQTRIADRGLLGLAEPRLSSTSTTLQDIIRFAWSWEATDPRDKIYALLGLASDRADSGIVPDYTSSVAALYKKVTIYHLQKYGFEFLELAGDTSLRRVDRLPSWCPDWSNFTWYNIDKCDPTVRHDIYHDSRDGTKPTLKLSPDQDALFVQGKIIDEVKTASVQRYIRPSGVTLVNVPIISNMISPIGKRIRWLRWQTWEKTALSLKVYPTGEELLSVYSQVLVAGSQEHRDQFNKFASDISAPANFSTEEVNAEDPKWFYRCFRRNELNVFEAGEGLQDADNSEKGAETLAACLYADEVENWSENRRLITTEKGYLGMGPITARAGDQICSLAGTKNPFLLRKVKKKYHLIGVSYVHGIHPDDVPPDELSEICIL